MDSKHIKIRLVDHYLYYGAVCAVTEFQVFGSYMADVFVVDNNMMPFEIEVKTGEGDLQGELNSIDYYYTRNKIENDPRYYSKLLKHDGYLRKRYSNYYITPSRFYFAVPDKLLKQAKEGLSKTPYGLILIPENINLIPIVVKKGRVLHNNKVDDVFMRDYLKKVSRENLSLRKKYEFNIN